MSITRPHVLDSDRIRLGCRRLAAWLLLALISFAAVSASAQALAVVTNLKGGVSRAAERGSSPVALLSELAQGADLTLDRGALLSLVYLASGIEFQLTGPARVSIGPTEPKTLSGSAPVARTSVVAAATVKLQTLNGRVVLGGMVMRGVRQERLKLIEPTGKVLSARPVFSWTMPDGPAAVQFVLREEASDRILVSRQVQGSSLALEDSMTLQAGVNYLWTVELGLPDAGRVIRSSYFSLAGEPERERMIALQPGAQSAFSDRLIYASLLEQARFVSESRKWWQQLALERPDLVELRSLGSP